MSVLNKVAITFRRNPRRTAERECITPTTSKLEVNELDWRIAGSHYEDKN
jgi:hypothetical protein